ncbi:hypothetical protein [Phenylobacterium aquaticum]|uniref:hypothetical protein n=1 Tax=Phenylobacterium aquaticum TaxID=1763816 RepID=UPI001F5C7A69|nr:hypothetical protein [Phenylobacterium aquaticum]MCI3131534.1 hypothetical protein [Phenylobacterium aquaticum]
MFASFAPFALALALIGGAGPPPELVASVQAELKDQPDAPSDAAKLFRRVDINGDGLQDWRVDYSSIDDLCTSGGCLQKLYLARPGGGYTLVLHTQIRNMFRLSHTREGHRLDVEVHGSNCGPKWPSECLRSFLWNEADGRFVEIPNRRGDGRLEQLLQLLAPDPATYPKSIASTVAATVRDCEARGGRLSPADSGVRRTPDLDGDGRSDWMVDASLLNCVDPKNEMGPFIEIGTGVTLLSGGEQGQPLFLPTFLYAFDVKTRPATFTALELVEGCGGSKGPPCPETTYRWDPGRRTLVPAPTAQGPRAP